MAIKFSQFVVQTDASTLSHIVGYNGADNIQITPTNFLNSLLTGTAGQVLFYDTTGVTGDNGFYWDNTNKRLGIGTATPTTNLNVSGNISVSSGSYLSFIDSNLNYNKIGRSTSVGGIQITTGGNATMNLLDNGNVGIGTTTPSEKLEVSGNIKVGDSEQFVAGAGNDLKIFHNGTNSLIENSTGDFYISNKHDDGDIIFFCDDGSGGTTTYFTLDGSRASGAYTYTTRPDGGVITFGDGLDLRLWHDPNTNKSYVRGYNHDLYIEAITADKDILFRADGGSGSITTYFQLDGSHSKMIAYKDIHFEDNIKARFGNYAIADLEIYHDGNNSNYITSTTSDIYLRNEGNNDTIYIQATNNGTIYNYIIIDGSSDRTVFSRSTRHNDNIVSTFGTSEDLQIYHDATDTWFDNFTGNLNIRNQQNSGDIIFRCDNGNGGIAEYFRVDGGLTKVVVNKSFIFEDNIQAQFGSSADLQIYHNSSNDRGYIYNGTGDLYIENDATDGDIKFFSDNGSGGTAEYFRLDGGTTSLVVSAAMGMYFNDGAAARFGTGGDLIIYHNGATNNSNIENNTGSLYLTNYADNEDIVFRSDDGSGGVAEYYKIDGGSTLNIFYKNVLLLDSVKSLYGSNSDLQIYHDSLNSYIKDGGTGELKLLASAVAIQSASGNEYIAYFAGTGGQTASLYAGNVKKLETKSTGINIQGVTEYANNTAALAGGLVVGDVYRTGDDLKIVH